MSEPRDANLDGVTLQELRRLRVQGDAQAVRRLVAAFDHPELGQQAASLLGLMRVPEAEAALIEGLRGHSSPEIRALCANGLAESESPGTLAALIETLRDNDATVVEWCCKTLGYREDAQAAEALRGILQHPEWKVRFAVVEALLNLGIADDEVVAELAHLTGEPEAELSDYGMKRSQQLDRLRGQLVEGRGIANTAGDLAAQLAQAREDLANPNELVRRTGVNRLRDFPGPEALVLLRAALEDSSAHVRATAVLALESEHTKEVIPDLIRHLSDDPSDYVRAICAFTLMWVQDLRTFEPLVDALKSDDSRLRSAATTALGRLGDQRAIPPLMEVLNDPQWTIRCGAAWALLDLRAADERLVTAIEQLAQQPEAEDWNLCAAESVHDLDMMRDLAAEAGDPAPRAQPTLEEMLGAGRELLRHQEVSAGSDQ